MASIEDCLDALESVMNDTATLPDRLKALEEKLKALDEALTNGEKQSQFLQQLPMTAAKPFGRPPTA